MKNSNIYAGEQIVVRVLRVSDGVLTARILRVQYRNKAKVRTECDRVFKLMGICMLCVFIAPRRYLSDGCVLPDEGA